MSLKHLQQSVLAGSIALGLMFVWSPRANAQPLWTSLDAGAVRRARTLPDFVELAAKLSPAVVNISTEQKNGNVAGGSSSEGESDPFDRFGQPFEHYGLSHPHSLGSGFIINKAGYILTNNHVVEDARQIVVTLRDGHEFTAHMIGHDGKTDVALVKIEPTYVLPVAPLGDSDDVRVGQWVMAIGNPFGFDHSVTAGIVSAKGRFIPGSYDEFIQTDASINPGNSGGPLIDIRGAVVGVNSAIYTRTGSSMGIGFAIPVNLVKQELPQLQAGGKVVRGWLGVYVEQVPAELALTQGLSEPHGAMIAGIIDNGPAAAAGLKRGDIIVEFDHRPINASQQLPLIVGSVPIGRTVMLKIIRNKAAKLVPITVAASREEQLARVARAEAGSIALGLSVEDLTPNLARELSLPDSRGVVVSAVTLGGAAAAAGIKPRDVILEINRRAVKDARSCEDALKAGPQSNIVLLLVRRERGTLFIPLKQQG
jgi:serine protease Do